MSLCSRNREATAFELNDRSQSFSFAAAFFSVEVRDDIKSLYRGLRCIDDLVDGDLVDVDLFADELAGGTRDIASVRRTICSLAAIYSSSDSVAIPALPAIFVEFLEFCILKELPKSLMSDFLSGQFEDVGRTQIATEEELLDYSYKVAGTVGLMILFLLGCDNPTARERAVQLGIAMQLTNIARDVREDALAGRFYLPATLVSAELVTSAVNYGDSAACTRVNTAVLRLLELADDFYRSSERGFAFLPRRERFAIVLAGRVYEAIARKIERSIAEISMSPVVLDRVSVSRQKKIEIAAQCLLKNFSPSLVEPLNSSESGEPTLRLLLSRHKMIFCCLSLVVACLYREFVPLVANSFLIELQVCIFFVAIFGIAHGALDYLPLQCSPFATIRESSSTNTSDMSYAIVVAGTYSVMALAFYGLWVLAAPVAMLCFLLLSIVHFAGLEKQILRPLGLLRSMSTKQALGLAIAGVPVLLPCGLAPNNVAPIISALMINPEHTQIVLDSLTFFGICWLIFVILLIYKIIKGKIDGYSSEILQNSILLGCLSFLALKVSPLVAFTVYFCGFHSVEETIKLSHALSPLNLRIGFKRFVLLAAVPTLVVLAASAFYFIQLDRGGYSTAFACSRMLFIVVSCITVPHFALRCLSKSPALFRDKIDEVKIVRATGSSQPIV